MKKHQLPPEPLSEIAWQVRMLLRAAEEQLQNRRSDQPLPLDTPIPVLVDMALARAVLIAEALESMELEAAKADA